jgi:2-C-methyl-D-erythritol 2,4-cyclodiphosphate synthase
MKIRVGFGYDVHRLAEGRTFVLGGVTIPHSRGPMGNSDADVLIHSICDALLGAANLRDIGIHFPDTSPEFKGIDSTILLKKVNDLLTERGYRIINLDTTICLQEPKIAAVIPEMKKILASVLGISDEDVSIKATTTEKLGFVGREEGISAYAVALIQSLS